MKLLFLLLQCIVPSLLLASASRDTFDHFHVPSFTVDSLTKDSKQVLQSLQEIGILAIRGIDGYAELRKEYLLTAAECTLKSKRGVLHKKFEDGTQRYTISADVTKNLDHVDCPSLSVLHEKFTFVIESALLEVARGLDSTKVSVQENNGTMNSMKELVLKGDHISHVHTYKSAEKRRLKKEGSLTLDIHTDLGIGIAMAHPAFVKYDAGKLTTMNVNGENGLVIRLKSGKLVRTVSDQDSLLFMIGEGFNSWTNFGLDLIEPVAHGMIMPENESEDYIRVWIGEMLLANQMNDFLLGQTFGEYKNSVTRSLFSQDKLSMSSAVCPHGRSLFASVEDDCVRKLYSNSTCTDRCNAHAVCPSYCSEYLLDTTEPGSLCWMACAEIPTCDTGTPQCNGGTAIISCQ